MTERNDVYEAWNHVKDSLKEEGVPCVWDDCKTCGRLKDAISVIDGFVDELTGRKDV